jgi:hypothetical protein
MCVKIHFCLTDTRYTKSEKGIIHKIKRELMKYLLLIIALTGATITAGCTGNLHPQVFGPAITEAQFGTAYSDSGQAVTVYSAQKTKTFTSIVYNVPSTKEASAGKTFVIIDAQIKNTGADPVTVFPHQFSIGDAEGNRFKKEPYYGDEWLKAGELRQNEYKRGKVLFEVPENSKNLVVLYDLNGKLVSWKID